MLPDKGGVSQAFNSFLLRKMGKDGRKRKGREEGREKIPIEIKILFILKEIWRPVYFYLDHFPH